MTELLGDWLADMDDEKEIEADTEPDAVALALRDAVAEALSV